MNKETEEEPETPSLPSPRDFLSLEDRRKSARQAGANSGGKEDRKKGNNQAPEEMKSCRQKRHRRQDRKKEVRLSQKRNATRQGGQ